MEQLRQKMGVVIVGPSGSSKSTLWKILRSALTKLGQSVKQYVMNPKAMPRTQVCMYVCMHIHTIDPVFDHQNIFVFYQK